MHSITNTEQCRLALLALPIQIIHTHCFSQVHTHMHACCAKLDAIRSVCRASRIMCAGSGCSTSIVACWTQNLANGTHGVAYSASQSCTKHVQWASYGIHGAGQLAISGCDISHVQRLRCICCSCFEPHSTLVAHLQMIPSFRLFNCNCVLDGVCSCNASVPFVRYLTLGDCVDPCKWLEYHLQADLCFIAHFGFFSCKV